LRVEVLLAAVGGFILDGLLVLEEVVHWSGGLGWFGLGSDNKFTIINHLFSLLSLGLFCLFVYLILTLFSYISF